MDPHSQTKLKQVKINIIVNLLGIHKCIVDGKKLIVLILVRFLLTTNARRASKPESLANFYINL